MISNILLDLQATINNPLFGWPEISDNNTGFKTNGIIIEGYKFTLVLSEFELGIPNMVSVMDSDGFDVSLLDHEAMCLIDWVMANVVPNYMVMN